MVGVMSIVSMVGVMSIVSMWSSMVGLLVEFFKVVWLFFAMSVMVSMMSMFVVHVIIIISVMVSVFLVVKLLQFAPSVALSMELSAITLSSLAQLIEFTAFVHR
jgi:hypothetical protein